MTDGQTDGQNYDSEDRASMAASRGKNLCFLGHSRCPPTHVHATAPFGISRTTASYPCSHVCRHYNDYHYNYNNDTFNRTNNTNPINYSCWRLNKATLE